MIINFIFHIMFKYGICPVGYLDRRDVEKKRSSDAWHTIHWRESLLLFPFNGHPVR
jgi:hypothetical protein